MFERITPNPPVWYHQPTFLNVSMRLKLALHQINFIQSRQLFINFDNYFVSPSPQVKSLGSLLHSAHMNNVTQSAFFHLGKKNHLPPSLTPSFTAVLVHSLVTSPTDYWNSFQLVSCHYKNLAAPIIIRTTSTHHITLVLQELHWLLINYHFKILLLTYKVIQNLASPFLSELIHINAPSHRPSSGPTSCLTSLFSAVLHLVSGISNISIIKCTRYTIIYYNCNLPLLKT